MTSGWCPFSKVLFVSFSSHSALEVLLPLAGISAPSPASVSEQLRRDVDALLEEFIRSSSDEYQIEETISFSTCNQLWSGTQRSKSFSKSISWNCVLTGSWFRFSHCFLFLFLQVLILHPHGSNSETRKSDDLPVFLVFFCGFVKSFCLYIHAGYRSTWLETPFPLSLPDQNRQTTTVVASDLTRKIQRSRRAEDPDLDPYRSRSICMYVDLNMSNLEVMFPA